MTRRLVLLGAGHAHLFVLEGLAQRPLPALQTTVVSADARQAYSGMVPGMIGGLYRLADLRFDLPAICRRAGVTFLESAAIKVAAAERRVWFADGGGLDYDLLSIATGSALEGSGVPGVAEHALSLKPISRAVEIVPALERVARRAPDPAVVVVGGGAAGIEVALAARARLRLFDRPAATVTLIESGQRLLGGQMPAAERAARHALAANGVRVELGKEVVAVAADAVRLDTDAAIPAALVIWATGAAATPLLRDSGLAVDTRGFLLVDDRLRSVSDPAVFAAGDAASLEGHAWIPKAGVYAVREGPVLWKNLASAARGAAPVARYRPQARFLALLNTGDGRAVVSYGAAATWSTWGMRLKDWIDRRFMRRFQALERV